MRKMKGKFLGILVAFAVAISTSNSSYLTANAESGTEVVATQTVYHVHDGDSVNGGGCYTNAIYHEHTGDSVNGGGCYTVVTTETRLCTPDWTGWVGSGSSWACGVCGETATQYDRRWGGECGCGGTVRKVEGCNHSAYGSWSTPADHNYQVTVYSLGCGMTEETVVGWGTPIYHSHSGDEINGGGCYNPIYHSHTGDSVNGGGCYNTVATTITKTCNYSVYWEIAPNQPHTDCPTCVAATSQTYHILAAHGHTCGVRNGDFHGYHICNVCGSTTYSYGFVSTPPGNYSHEYTTTIYDVGCGMTEDTVLGYQFACSLDDSGIVGYTPNCGLGANEEMVILELEKAVGEAAYVLSVNSNVKSERVEITGYTWSDGTTERTVNVIQNAVYSCAVNYTDNGVPKTAIIEYEVTDFDMVPPTLAIDVNNATSEIVVTELTDNFALHEMPVRYFNGTEWTEWTTALTYSVSAGGVYMVQARDSVNNIAEASISLAQVTCIDHVSEQSLDLGTYTWIDKVGNSVSSSSLGTDITPDLYYDGYTYVSDMTETLVEEGVTVYRYFTPTTHILAAYSGTEYFLGSPVMSSQIESLLFASADSVPADAIGSMDVRHSTSISSVFMWWYDNDADGLYEVTIASKTKTELYADSSHLFKDLSSCIKIEGMSGNVTMENVTNTTGMFEGCVSLRQLDAPLAVREENTADLPNFEGRKWVEKAEYCEAYTAEYTKLPIGLAAPMTIVNIPNEINSTYKIALPASMSMTVEIIPATEESAEKYVIKASETISIAYCMPTSNKKLVVKTEFVDADPKIVLSDGTTVPLTVTTYVPDENGELQLLENNTAVYQQPSESYELQTKQIELRICSEEMDVDLQSGTYECTNIQFVIDIED